MARSIGDRLGARYHKSLTGLTNKQFSKALDKRQEEGRIYTRTASAGGGSY